MYSVGAQDSIQYLSKRPCIRAAFWQFAQREDSGSRSVTEAPPKKKPMSLCGRCCITPSQYNTQHLKFTLEEITCLVTWFPGPSWSTFQKKERFMHIYIYIFFFIFFFWLRCLFWSQIVYHILWKRRVLSDSGATLKLCILKATLCRNWHFMLNSTDSKTNAMNHFCYSFEIICNELPYNQISPSVNQSIWCIIMWF